MDLMTFTPLRIKNDEERKNKERFIVTFSGNVN